MLIVKDILSGAYCMVVSLFKIAWCWIILSGLLLMVAACTSTEPIWKGKPVTVEEVLVNPDKYDGKMLQVEGRVSSLQINASRVGPYTTFR
jgi:hypothetical protein